jgi:hypothetical protein
LLNDKKHDNKLKPGFVLGQIMHEATRGRVWTDVNALIAALSNKRHFTTTDLELMLRDLISEGKIVKERKRAGHGMTSKVLDHYALK